MTRIKASQPDFPTPTPHNQSGKMTRIKASQPASQPGSQPAKLISS